MTDPKPLTPEEIAIVQRETMALHKSWTGTGASDRSSPYYATILLLSTLTERDKRIAELEAEVADLEHCRLCGKHGVEVTTAECGFAASPKCLFADRARSALTEGEKS